MVLDCSTPHSWWTVHSSSNLHGDREAGWDWFTVCALCYSTNNTLCALGVMVTDYMEVGVLVSFKEVTISYRNIRFWLKSHFDLT